MTISILLAATELSVTAVVLILVALVVGAVIGVFVGGGKAKRDVDAQVQEAEKRGVEKGIEQRKATAEAAIGSAEQEAERIRSSAVREADDRKKSALVEAKDEIFRLRSEAEKEIKDRRSEMARQERRIQQKEESLDKKSEHFERKEEQLQAKLHAADERLAEAEEIKKNGTEEIEKLKRSQIDMLERISELTRDQARDQLLQQLDQDLVHEKALKITAYEQQIKTTCEDIARSHISMAIAKCAAEQVSEVAVSVVPLPNDEMKGRIIGREGRNIRSIESLTGVDLIIDDTPEAITLSCFDPVRREVARIALEKLILDGRIHPASIEEKVDKARREVEKRIKQEGERAVLETNVHGLNPELIRLLGRLTFRTSYRQNVLNHSIEVATLSGILASELGVDANMARRAGLLHDIGKALTAEIEGSHVAIGVDVCRKYKEPAEVIHAVEAHHNDVEPRTAIACIVQAADAISAARPGARSENLESYIKRLQKLEEICMSYEGVEKCFAMQAGREVRIMVKPEVIDDERMVLVAREIAQQIENDMEYPGQIKVNLIRESRVMDVAK
jgi:ribonuclease Y